MHNSASSSELQMWADCSGRSTSNLLFQRRTQKNEARLMSFSSEEDEDEVQFDSKQLFSLHLTDSVH